MRQPVTPCEQAYLDRLWTVCPDAKWYHGGSARRVGAETLLATFWEMAEDWQAAVDWARAHPEDVSRIQSRQHKVDVDWIDAFPSPEPGVLMSDI